jgi:hypothetical protein
VALAQAVAEPPARSADQRGEEVRRLQRAHADGIGHGALHDALGAGVEIVAAQARVRQHR